MTNILSYADAVVAIPPNPYRYINRGWSFPDILAKGIQKYLALPYEQFALKLIDTNLELRGLNSFERRTRIRGAICADNIGLAKGREVILVDDVITSGATMQEAARHLKGAGVKKVHAIALCHTEG
jgi:predicted amidophosphoribosyltransferase